MASSLLRHTHNLPWKRVSTQDSTIVRKSLTINAPPPRPIVQASLKASIFLGCLNHHYEGRRSCSTIQKIRIRVEQKRESCKPLRGQKATPVGLHLPSHLPPISMASPAREASCNSSAKMHQVRKGRCFHDGDVFGIVEARGQDMIQ